MIKSICYTDAADLITLQIPELVSEEDIQRHI